MSQWSASEAAKQIDEHADAQADQSAGEIDRLDLASRLPQPLIDNAFVLGRRRRRPASAMALGGDSYSTRHGGSSEAVVLPLPL